MPGGRRGMLLIDNDIVKRVLTMRECIEAQERAFAGTLTGASVSRPRIDMFVPCNREDGYYRWGSVEGASDGVLAVRLKSDIMTWPEGPDGTRTESKYCIRPGTYCGLVLLFSTQDGAPLAIINDGYLQHMRVGASAGIGARLLAREDARRRLGSDLHDGLGQQLTAIELMCETLRSNLGSASPDAQQQADQVCHFLRQAIGHTRGLAHGLAPFKVESGGLHATLLELAQTTTALRRLKCRLECPATVPTPSGETATHLYRIAQEAVHNAVRHSKASEITIRLSIQKDTLRLEIVDNGKGLPQTAQSGPGMGLHIMKHRASVIGAELDLNSQPGKGVTVTCTLPIPKSKPATSRR
jgi:hypothetical protein